MSHQYAPRTFLRLVPNQLLKEFFDRRNMLKDFLWYLQREREITTIYNTWQKQPENQIQEIDMAFRDVYEMACQGGIQALLEEAHFHGVDLASEWEHCECLLGKAMWAYLRRKEIFDIASSINLADSLLRGRYFVCRAGLPRKKPNTTKAARSALANAISGYYRTEQGRGYRCTVESYLRSGRYQYFIAYPDDYIEMHMVHEDNGELIRRPHKKAFEIVYRYDPEEGRLDLFARGNKEVWAKLQQFFCLNILGEELPPEQKTKRIYELDALISSDFAFPTDPEDGIEAVVLLKLRLSLLDEWSQRVTFEVDAKAAAKEIYGLIRQVLRRDVLIGLYFRVAQAEFRFRFAERAGKRRKPLDFSVADPDKINLKGKEDQDQRLVEKYLKRWGIDRA